jgi:TRAP-type C4-dicarboxylate transport system permease small subunit
MSLQRFDRLLHAINSVLFAVCAVLLTALVFMVGTDVTLRYLFNRPLGWVKEISEYIMLLLPFLLASWIMETDGHLKMDLVLNAVSPRARNLMNAVTYTVGSCIVAILVAFSLRVTVDFYRTSHFTATLLRLPKAIFIAVIFFGLLMLLCQLIRKIIGFISVGQALDRTEKEHVIAKGQH